ncbi:gamma-aminobutyric acid type B receptor subunit 2-like isoform X2 [Oscarella lobularis]|uniref:gamma-aminobutyric acid type B receptor subunit 2-like isoform X2 n=1 Tax=Oscarella lobularis TaxID=121494 RepID=UPI0033133734
MRRFLRCVVLCFLALAIQPKFTTATNSNTTKQPIYLVALLPTDATSGAWTAEDSDIACEIAVDDINNAKNLLDGYELRLRKKPTDCSSGVAGYELFHQLNDSNKFVALVAAGCSSVTQSIAAITQHFSLFQFSFLSSSPALEDRKRYPFYRQIKPYENGLNFPRMSLLKLFKWEHAVVLYEDAELFRLNAQNLFAMKNEANVTMEKHFVSSNDFDENLSEVLKKVQSSQIRIIFALFYADTGVKIVCKASKLGMTSRDYVWIFPGWYHYFDDRPVCFDEMKKTINGHFTIDLTRIPASDNQTVLPDRTFAGFKQEYIKRTGKAFKYYGAYGYDTIVAIAHMLNRSLAKDPRLLANFDYGSRSLASILNATLQEVSFVGFTGNVAFPPLPDDITYRSKANISYRRYYDLENGPLISVNVEDHCNDSNSVSDCLKWTTPDGEKPVSFPSSTLSSTSIFYVVMTIDIISISLTILLLCFTFYHREKRIVKLSSPRMNNLIGLGAVLIFIAVLLNGFNGQFFPFNNNSLRCCSARDGLLVYGFSLAFGSMFAKTWRVSMIFKRSKTGKTSSDLKLTDHILFAFVGVLLLIDTLFLGLWYGLDPYKKETAGVGEDLFKCHSNNANRWSYIILAYKGVILAIGAFIAFETRNVHIASLNDSRFIAQSIYNTVIACVLAFAFSFVTNAGVAFALWGTSIIVMTSTVVGLVFVPKVYYLVFRKNDSVANVGRMGSKGKGSINDHTFAKKSDLKQLREQNRQQKNAMLMMLEEKNLTESTIQRIKVDFGLLLDNGKNDSEEIQTDFTMTTSPTTTNEENNTGENESET